MQMMSSMLAIALTATAEDHYHLHVAIQSLQAGLPNSMTYSYTKGWELFNVCSCDMADVDGGSLQLQQQISEWISSFCLRQRCQSHTIQLQDQRKTIAGLGLACDHGHDRTCFSRALTLGPEMRSNDGPGLCLVCSKLQTNVFVYS